MFVCLSFVRKISFELLNYTHHNKVGCLFVYGEKGGYIGICVCPSFVRNISSEPLSLLQPNLCHCGLVVFIPLGLVKYVVIVIMFHFVVVAI